MRTSANSSEAELDRVCVFVILSIGFKLELNAGYFFVFMTSRICRVFQLAYDLC